MHRSTAPSFAIWGFAVALSLVLVFSPAPASGQAISGNLLGTIVDSSGASVANADVAALKLATGIITTTKTDSTGAYHFDDLPAGTYKITAKAAGFRAISEQVEVEVNKAGTVNMTLTPGASDETVEVSGLAAAIDTSTAQIATTFNSRFSEDLGIAAVGGGVGAGVQNLSLLSPGVTNANAMGDGMGPSVGGQRPRDNNFTIEGVDNNNKSVTGALAWVPNDGVDSFTLLSNQFNAEFGHSSGGQFNTTIKTGTNSFHGSLYEYFGNRNMDALDNTYVLQGLTSNPRYDNNRYGGTFGGPIVKNKLFFFTLYDREPVGLTGTGGGTVDAPTAAGLAAISSDPSLSATNLGVFTKYVPVAPAGSGCIEYNGLISGTNLPINSASGATNFSAPANGSCAAGSVEVGPLSISAPGWDKFQDYVQSVDYNLSEKDQIRGRFVWNKEDQIDTNANLAAFYLPQSFRYYLFTVGEYHTFTPSLVNEFRVGFNRYANVLPASGSFSFPGVSEFPNLQFFDLGAGLQVGPDTNAPSSTIQNLYQGVDNVSWTKGRHTLKFGGEYRWFISPQQFTQRERGDYEYNTTQVYMEDFSPDNFGERGTGKTVYYGNEKAVYGYVNDNWRMTSNFSLNLGVRYEFTTLPLSEGQQSLNAISNDPSIIVAQVNKPLLFGKPTVPKNNWAPRIGFAYSPGSSATTSIRGGFGMAYDTLYDNIGSLAVPPQLGSTNDVASFTALNPAFLGSGGLGGGGSGVTVIPDQATARASTANWIPPNIEWPYSINWTLGVQHAFGKNYTAEVNYVGTRGVHLDVQDQINKQTLVNSQNFLPTYLQMPSQSELDGLTNTLAALTAASANHGEVLPAFRNDGFTTNITSDLPLGSSSYNGLETSLVRRFSNGLMFQASYTWSHDIDNATADFHSTDLSPRRPQDFANFAAERATSALSRTHRLTIAAVYDLPYFKQGNWLMQNVIGNWSFSPVYTYESPEYVTVQSTQDSNFNGDAAGDRAILNPAGTPGTGSDVIPLTNTAGDTVAYCACGAGDNPGAQYIRAGRGALADVGRNTLPTAPTNNIDLGVYKTLNITERVKFKLGGQFFNVLNHPQYLPNTHPGQGLGVNDVTSFNSTGGNYQSYVTPGNANFDIPKAVFSSNSRTIAIVGKITF